MRGHIHGSATPYKSSLNRKYMFFILFIRIMRAGSSVLSLK